MKNYKNFLLENVSNFILSDNIRNILESMISPIAKDILSIKNLKSPIYLDVKDENNFGFAKSPDERIQPIRIGKFINRNLRNESSDYNDTDIENFVNEYKRMFLGFSFNQKSLDVKYSKNETLTYINSAENYINSIDKEMIKSIIHHFCKDFTNNKIVFYRGDRKLTGEGFIVNSDKTITQLEHDFNYIGTEFISSKLWKKRNYPLLKQSLNMAKDPSIAKYFSGDSIYKTIPLDGAKIVGIPTLFGNYSPPIFDDERLDFNNASLSMYLKDIIGKDINIDNVKDIIKELSVLYDDGKIKDSIYKRMKYHNMSFIDYMEYIFSPDVYDVIDYKNMNNKFLEKYNAFYTNQKALMISDLSVLNENITNEGRWGSKLL